MGIVRGWWLAAYLALLFGALPFTGDAWIGLRDGPFVDLALTAGYLAVALATVHRIVLDHRLSDVVAFAVLAALALAAGALTLGLTVPEERVHFLEYAVLAWLVRRALPQLDVPLAFLVCVTVAIADETIQHLLPNRVGDVADVALDVAAAAVALIYDEAVHGRIHRSVLRKTRGGRTDEPSRPTHAFSRPKADRSAVPARRIQDGTSALDR